MNERPEGLEPVWKLGLESCHPESAEGPLNGPKADEESENRDSSSASALFTSLGCGANTTLLVDCCDKTVIFV